MIIYRRPEGLDSLTWTVPVWQTRSALTIQDRLLAALLPHPRRVMGSEVYFPAYMHNRIYRELRKAGGDLLELLPNLSGEALTFLMSISAYLDMDFTLDELWAMMRTVAWQFSMQQEALESLDRATLAWNGKLQDCTDYSFQGRKCKDVGPNEKAE